jgi:hypothetical protein
MNRSAAASEVRFAEMLGWPLGVAALLCLMRRRKLVVRLLGAAALMVAMGAGLNGCSSGTATSSALLTPLGTSTVNVTFADSGGVSHVVTLSFTVNAPYTSP